VPAGRRLIRQAEDHAPWRGLREQPTLSAYWVAVEHGMGKTGREAVHHEKRHRGLAIPGCIQALGGSMSKSPIAWLDDVAEHDYDAACNYLSLKFDEKRAGEIIDRMKKAS
jgi:hypothetical protein